MDSTIPYPPSGAIAIYSTLTNNSFQMSCFNKPVHKAIVFLTKLPHFTEFERQLKENHGSEVDLPLLDDFICSRSQQNRR